jgi:hypothetical protein
MPGLLLLLAAITAASPPPLDEALFQHFLKVLPDAKEPPRTGADPAEVARLATLNRGRERDVETLLAADAACTAPVRQAAVLRMARATADRLGREKVDRMIAFYEGPGFVRWQELASAVRADAAPSPGERAEMARLTAAYPLQDFADALQAGSQVLFTDGGLGAAFSKCADARVAAFAKAGLKE